MSTPWCSLFALRFLFHANHACYSLSLPGLNSFPPLSESNPSSCDATWERSGCDATWERFSPTGSNHWVSGKEVVAMALLQLLHCAPCWLMFFIPQKENRFGFSTAVCYFVQGRYYCCGGRNTFWQGKPLLK